MHIPPSLCIVHNPCIVYTPLLHSFILCTHLRKKRRCNVSSHAVFGVFFLLCASSALLVDHDDLVGEMQLECLPTMSGRHVSCAPYNGRPVWDLSEVVQLVDSVDDIRIKLPRTGATNVTAVGDYDRSNQFDTCLVRALSLTVGLSMVAPSGRWIPLVPRVSPGVAGRELTS